MKMIKKVMEFKFKLGITESKTGFKIKGRPGGSLSASTTLTLRDVPAPYRPVIYKVTSKTKVLKQF
jgi:hypothetical protein